MTRKKAFITVAVVLALAAVAAANLYYRRDTGVAVNVEEIGKRDLEAIVSASGKVQPKRRVNISANRPGRVTRLAVEEGQRVTAGQFLLEIDPRSLEGQLQRSQASVEVARQALELARTALKQAQANLELAEQNFRRQEELWKDGLTTRQEYERAQNELTVRRVEVMSRQQEIETREVQIRQEEATLATTRYDLDQVIINSPMDGIVTRRNIEEGETAVVGTMNNPGTVLLEIADMSVLEAEIEVDETDIPLVELGQRARVTIDAVPGRTFAGTVTEIGNSPIQATGTAAAAGQRQATTFKVVVTLDERVDQVRPGFTCTAEITTAVRDDAVAVPIQALTVRELLFDPEGRIVREPPRRRGTSVEPTVTAAEPPPGHTREEKEGVFVLRDGRAVFTPVEIGIAGEQYFEVLSGLQPGDQVITGPFASVRELADGQDVRVQETPRAAP